MNIYIFINSLKFSFNISVIETTIIMDKIVDNILANSQKQIEDYHNGKTNLFGFFVGQVMKETKGKANPVKVNEILKDKLK